jgi:hypothetical protein
MSVGAALLGLLQLLTTSSATTTLASWNHGCSRDRVTQPGKFTSSSGAALRKKRPVWLSMFALLSKEAFRLETS